MTPRRAHFALLCVVGLVAGACTGSGTAPGPNATAVGSPAGGDGALPPATGPPPIFEPDDEVLDVAIPEPATLDPMRIQDPGSALVARQLFEGLVRWDPTLERVRPAAAEGWRASGDGTTFVFKLHEGMTFHDGSPVTSKDFAFAFDRIALKENAADLAYTIEKVAGFPEVNQAGTATHLAGITTPNDLTLVIRLAEPYHDFPLVLTHPGLVPVPSRAVGRLDEFLARPTGNGPFQMAREWHPGEPVVLEAFPGFIETPELDGIRFISYPDAAASYVDFLKGDLDVAEVPAGQVEDAERRFGSQGFLPFLKSEYLGLNIRSAALDDIRLRKAVNLAIDRKDIGETVYRGTLAEPRGIVPTGIPGFQENICVDLCRHSPKAATRLVRKLPRRARSVTLDYTTGPPLDLLAREIAEDLRSVGLRAKSKGYGFARFLRRLRDGKEEGYRLGWFAEYPAADVFLDPLFRSTSSDNHSGFASSRVDSLLNEAHRTRSDGRRLVLFVEAEKEIMRSVPVVPIGSFTTHWAARRDVRGIRFDVMGGFDAVGVFLAQE